MRSPTEQYFIVKFFCEQIVSIHCARTVLPKAFLLCQLFAKTKEPNRCLGDSTNFQNV